jgi:putative peptidoglycan lipid II flippase
MYAVCGGVLLAGVLQIVVVGVTLRRIRFFPIFGRSWGDPQLRRVLTLMAPMALGLSVVQINTLADNVIAYLFIVVDGERVGPAVLGYAHFLYQLPLGVFGISLATAIFPVLSARATAGDMRGMAEVLERGLRLAIFIALPASIGLMLVASPLVASLYERGEFDAADTRRVAGTLVFYAIGLVAYFVQHTLVRAFYSLDNSRTPARIALAMVGVNLAMNLSLVHVLQERGLALATAICAAIQVLWLLRRLRRSLPELRWRRIGVSAAKTVAATGLMTLAILALISSGVFPAIGSDDPVVRLITLVVVGVGVFGAVARLLDMEELRQVIPGGKREPE